MFTKGYPHCFKRRPAAHGGRKHPTYHDVIGKLVQVGELRCAYIYIYPYAPCMVYLPTFGYGNMMKYAHFP